MAIRAAEAKSALPQAPQVVDPIEMPYNARISLGLAAGHHPFLINARTDTPITTTLGQWTDIRLFPFSLPATPEEFEVVSDNVADDGSPEGTGARDVIIWGLPADKSQEISVYEPPFQSELVVMDGLTAVRTANTYHAVLGARVGQRGSNGANVGNVDVRRASDSNVAVRIEAGRGDARLDTLHVPLDWGARLTRIWVWWTGVTSAIWELREDTGGGQQRTVWDGEVVASNSGSTIELCGGIILSPGSSYWFRARRNVGPASETLRINAAGHLYNVAGGSVPDTAPGG